MKKPSPVQLAEGFGDKSCYVDLFQMTLELLCIDEEENFGDSI